MTEVKIHTLNLVDITRINLGFMKFDFIMIILFQLL